MANPVPPVAQFRQDFREYLRNLDCADAWRAAASSTAEEGLAHDATVMARLNADGWNRYGWPEEVGGLGGNEIHRAVYYEELGYAMLPIPAQQWTLEVLGPAVIRFAPELAARYLPEYLRGNEWWGQGFSEPESGSDLASLRTRAVDDDDGGFVVTGQKIWTSQGSTAKRLLVLVRTGTPESRHRGLSMLLIDTDTPGVTVRPIALASGRRELAEVFFEDVRVPRERLIGELNGGWAVTMFLMQYERGMYGYAVLNKVFTELGRLREYMVTNGATAAQRERFARVYVDLIAAQARTGTTVRRLAAGHTLGPESSIDKLLFSRAERAVNDLILDVARSHMLVGPPDVSPAALDTARAEWWYSRAATIMGGTAEVQRGIIADHLLGLPKEKRVS
ncbi:acyl-CoA dehydrogenase, N-terminal domain protein [Mycolicibacterium hassiacum DSM 44199]|uniref:Acyl-CoA dehydrogenase, N-terminal domain protein n=1 Tax=Mycolicibacterium hassiacum (strain DSM 44199 / CIP 105218 / JCM 12690 / 3849) TaxID=1122247 RepID=K5BCY3_MYCHD|nr:acyl-CoA dehydrogenase family protein [Mycolicibacterium hassiacum]EKF21151.1 acyl-CoA dehydrogenase, N-terminal domain protein [Mycolicibacterium hassiacum DSM 44199]MBX5487341.1 acyl-CoA dehydrogenase family protein [Mycolicibacterium hassiacum]MDA4086374.1 acyl-CoA dehydrogenase [Mycolicibacterium hassiacum DSM 44199]PZN19021.1 MAG: acyl-CoA dehydrogenase [Mycolicibacterium hassiacum]VCT91349.1 Putative acyl-CoA dehydrogenase FadE17 [Mycolicibacterium hassiacum DSM 44199]